VQVLNKFNFDERTVLADFNFGLIKCESIIFALQKWAL